MDKQIFSKIEITKQLSYILLGLAILVIVLVDFFFVMKPQARTLGTLGQKVKESSQGVKETKDNLQRLPAFQAEIVKLKEKLGKVEKSILPKEEAILAVDRISQLASKTGVKINQIAPLNNAETKVLSSSQGEYFSLPIALSAEGGYHDIGVFFSKIESDETFMSIESFEIAKDASTSKKSSMTATINVFIVKK